MKCSKSKKELEKILDTILTLLDGAVMRNVIEEPVDAAVSSFSLSVAVSDPIGNKELLAVAGEFVAHVHEYVLPLDRGLDRNQARGRALRMLESSYQGMYVNGYEGALRDVAKYRTAGLRTVFATLAEGIKEDRRQQYVARVFKIHFAELDWYSRRDLTMLILKRWKRLLDPDTAQRPPEELIQACPQLVLSYVASGETLRQMLGTRRRQKRTGTGPEGFESRACREIEQPIQPPLL